MREDVETLLIVLGIGLFISFWLVRGMFVYLPSRWDCKEVYGESAELNEIGSLQLCITLELNNSEILSYKFPERDCPNFFDITKWKCEVKKQVCIDCYREYSCNDTANNSNFSWIVPPKSSIESILGCELVTCHCNITTVPETTVTLTVKETEGDCRYWNYSILNFLPCVGDAGMFGVPSSDLNKSLSPEENCLQHKGHFYAFNTRSKERNEEYLNAIKPSC